MLEELNEFFSGRKRISKAGAIKFYVAIVMFFTIFILLAFKFTYFSFIFIVSVALSFTGVTMFMYYDEELDEKFHLRNGIVGTYQSGAVGYLSLSTLSFGVLLFCIFLIRMDVLKSLLVAFIFTLPFLGIGLRFNCFHDDSRFVGDEVVIGYHPFYYLFCAYNICFLGYYQIFFENLVLNKILLFILTSFCFLWVIFPDKLNRFMPIDNRTKLGFVIYLGFILVVFFLCLKQIVPVGFVEVLNG